MSKDFSELGSERASKCMSRPHIMHIKGMCMHCMQCMMYANQPINTLCNGAVWAAGDNQINTFTLQFMPWKERDQSTQHTCLSL